jgi:hypothetical protein
MARGKHTQPVKILDVLMRYDDFSLKLRFMLLLGYQIGLFNTKLACITSPVHSVGIFSSHMFWYLSDNVFHYGTVGSVTTSQK